MDDSVSPDKQPVEKSPNRVIEPDKTGFIAPETVGENEDILDVTATVNEKQIDRQASFVHKPVPLPRWLQFSKKQWIIVGVVLILLVGGGATYALTRKSPPPKPVHHVLTAPKKVTAPTPTIVPSTLTGLPVSPSVNALPVTATVHSPGPSPALTRLELSSKL
jgi:hypothetical protein